MSHYNIVKEMSEEISELYNLNAGYMLSYALNKMANTDPQLTGDELIDLACAYNIFAIEASSKYKGEKIAGKYRTYNSKEEFYKLVIEKQLEELKEVFQSQIKEEVDLSTPEMIIEDEPTVEELPKNENIEVISEAPVEIVKEEQIYTQNIIDVPKEVKIDKPEKDNSVKLHQEPNYIAGGEVYLTRANLYLRLYDKVPSRCLTGIYYFCTGIKKDGRYSIVMRSEYANDSRFILGYINASDT